MFDSSKYTSRGRFKRTKFTPSTVDESLFGERRTTLEPDPVPEFEPPWVDNGKTKLKPPPKPLLFYCPSSPSRPSSRASSTTPLRKYKPPKFSPTVVDHTLFGTYDEKPEGHDLQMEKYFTSMPPKQLLFDDSVSNVDKNETFRSASQMSERSRPCSRSEQRTQHELKKPLPPWR